MDVSYKLQTELKILLIYAIFSKYFSTYTLFNSLFNLTLINHPGVTRVNVSVKILAFRSGFTRNKYQCDPDTCIKYLFLKFV